MKCRTICEHLSAYLDGELPDDLAREVREHLVSCAVCRTELESLREVTGVLHALPREPAPDVIEQRVVSYIEEDILLRTPERARWVVVARKTLTGLGLAAAALLVGLSVWIYFTPYGERPSDVTVTDYTVPERAGHADVAERVKEDSFRSKAGGDSTVARAPETLELYAKAPAPSVATRGEPGPVADMKSATTLAGDLLGEAKEAEGKPAAPKTGLDLGRPAGTVNGVVTDLAQTRSGTEDKKQTTPVVTSPTPAPAFEGPRIEPAGTTARPETARRPAQPEFLDLELVDDDFAAARAHIIAVAASLDIPSVELGRVSGRSGDVSGDGYRWGVTGVDAEAAHGGTGKDVPSADAGVLKGKFEAARSDGKDRPAVVLAVEEGKLPRLVARLAVPRPRGVADRADTAGAKPTAPAPTPTPQGGEPTAKPAETPSAETARKPVEKDVTVQVLDELDRLRREARARTRTTEAPRSTEAPAVRPAETPADTDDTGKTAGRRTSTTLEEERAARTDAPMQKALEQAEERKLVYLRIYLRQPPAATVPAARTTPASK